MPKHVHTCMYIHAYVNRWGISVCGKIIGISTYTILYHTFPLRWVSPQIQAPCASLSGSDEGSRSRPGRGIDPWLPRKLGATPGPGRPRHHRIRMFLLRTPISCHIMSLISSCCIHLELCHTFWHYIIISYLRIPSIFGLPLLFWKNQKFGCNHQPWRGRVSLNQQI